MNTFRKNKAGEWVVMGSVSEVRIGKVRVERKDRSVRTVDVVSVGRPFSANGTMMVYGYLNAAHNKEAPAPKAEVEVDQEALDEVAAETQAERAAEDNALRGADAWADSAEACLF